MSPRPYSSTFAKMTQKKKKITGFLSSNFFEALVLEKLASE